MVVHIQVFLFLLAADGFFLEGFGHPLFFSQVDDLGFFGAEPDDASEGLQNVFLGLLLLVLLVIEFSFVLCGLILLFLGFLASWCDSAFRINGKCGRADDVLDPPCLQVLFGEVLVFEHLNLLLLFLTLLLFALGVFRGIYDEVALLLNVVEHLVLIIQVLHFGPVDSGVIDLGLHAFDKLCVFHFRECFFQILLLLPDFSFLHGNSGGINMR